MFGEREQGGGQNAGTVSVKKKIEINGLAKGKEKRGEGVRSVREERRFSRSK